MDLVVTIHLDGQKGEVIVRREGSGGSEHNYRANKPVISHRRRQLITFSFPGRWVGLVQALQVPVRGDDSVK